MELVALLGICLFVVVMAAIVILGSASQYWIKDDTIDELIRNRGITYSEGMEQGTFNYAQGVRANRRSEVREKRRREIEATSSKLTTP